MFYTVWILTAVVLVVAAAIAGKRSNQKATGLLIDSRGRYSLNHFQVVMWTILVLSVWMAVLVGSSFDPSKLVIPNELLLLMGISLGSATVSGAVKAGKDDSGARVAREGSFTLSDGTTKRDIEPKPSQMFLEEEGDSADRAVSVTKFQNYIFTIVAGITYVSLVVKAPGFPELPQELVWLIGISHAGYVGGKIPNKK